MRIAPSPPPAVAAHLLALEETAARLDLEPRQLDAQGRPTEPAHGWLCRAVAERIEADLAVEVEQRRSVADDIASLLVSGLMGIPLCTALWRQFPVASRQDVFDGAAMAVSLFQADIALAELDAASAATNRAEAA